MKIAENKKSPFIVFQREELSESDVDISTSIVR